MSEKKNIEIFNWELLTKYLNNETTSDEKIEVENWLNKSDENLKEMEKCREMLDKVDGYYKTKGFNGCINGGFWDNLYLFRAP